MSKHAIPLYEELNGNVTAPVPLLLSERIYKKVIFSPLQIVLARQSISTKASYHHKRYIDLKVKVSSFMSFMIKMRIHRLCGGSILYKRVLIVVFLYILKAVVVSSQDVCSCTPLVYNWTLDLNKNCDPINVTVGPETGISEVFCSIDLLTNSSTTINNLVPVEVTAYQIIELNFELTPLKSKSEANVSLSDGDFITFASITAAEPMEYSGGFQVSLVGVNDALQGVALEWLVRFTNLCEQTPFTIGDSIGWMVFVSEV